MFSNSMALALNGGLSQQVHGDADAYNAIEQTISDAGGFRIDEHGLRQGQAVTLGGGGGDALARASGSGNVPLIDETTSEEEIQKLLDAGFEVEGRSGVGRSPYHRMLLADPEKAMRIDPQGYALLTRRIQDEADAIASAAKHGAKPAAVQSAPAPTLRLKEEANDPVASMGLERPQPAPPPVQRMASAAMTARASNEEQANDGDRSWIVVVGGVIALVFILSQFGGDDG